MYTYTCIKYTIFPFIRKEGKYTFSLFFRKHIAYKKGSPDPGDPKECSYAFFFLTASAIANGVVTSDM